MVVGSDKVVSLISFVMYKVYPNYLRIIAPDSRWYQVQSVSRKCLKIELFLSRGKWWHVNLKKHGYDARTNRLVMANLSSEHNLLVTLFECPNWFTVEINVKYKIVPD